MKYKLLLLIGLVSLMVIVAGCGLTPGESLAGNARATGRNTFVKEKVVAPLERGGCYSDGECATDQFCQGAKNAANPAYSKKGSCVGVEKTFCLKYHEPIPLQLDGPGFSMIQGGGMVCGAGFDTETKKKTTAAYVCKANSFPLDKINGACPVGTKGSFYSEMTYDCEGGNKPFNFKGCLSGYTLVWDFSQNLTNKAGVQVYSSYSIRCGIDNLLVDWKEPGHSIACGNSGAIAGGKAMLEKQGGYCCNYMQ